jgi:hypothetical protein
MDGACASNGAGKAESNTRAAATIVAVVMIALKLLPIITVLHLRNTQARCQGAGHSTAAQYQSARMPKTWAIHSSPYSAADAPDR